MGGLASLFSKPKPPKPPPVPPPPAIPQDTGDAGDYAAKLAQRRSGFRKTVLTGSLEPNTGKKSVLG